MTTLQLVDWPVFRIAGTGWKAEVHPQTHPVNELEFDVIIGADGRRNTLPGEGTPKRNRKRDGHLEGSSFLQTVLDLLPSILLSHFTLIRCTVLEQ